MGIMCYNSSFFHNVRSYEQFCKWEIFASLRKRGNIIDLLCYNAVNVVKSKAKQTYACDFNKIFNNSIKRSKNASGIWLDLGLKTVFFESFNGILCYNETSICYAQNYQRMFLYGASFLSSHCVPP